jgi:hypothetical protein
VVFVPRVPLDYIEDLRDKPSQPTGWFSKIKRLVGIESSLNTPISEDSEQLNLPIAEQPQTPQNINEMF